MLSLSARRSGLLVGDVLRDRVRTRPVRDADEIFVLWSCEDESTLNARLKPEGDRGAGAMGAFGEEGPFVVRSANLDGFDGERERERRIWRMVLKPSRCGDLECG